MHYFVISQNEHLKIFPKIRWLEHVVQCLMVKGELCKSLKNIRKFGNRCYKLVSQC
jgi:hypothetical protein